MNETEELNKFENLICHTVKTYARHTDRSKSTNTIDDFLQEGRIAALKAIRTYSEGQNVKLTTYIASCVRNRMYDMHRRTKAQRVPSIDVKEDIRVYETGTCHDNQKLETKMTLAAYLDSDEFEMIMPLLEDGSTVNDLVKDLTAARTVGVEDKYEKNRAKQESREDVVACLCRVQRLLGLRGRNQRLKTSLSLVK